MERDILRAKKGFSLIEITITMAIVMVLMSVVLFSSGKTREVAQAKRTIEELNNIAVACSNHYNDTGAWPANLAALRPKYFTAGASDNNPFGNIYTISPGVNQVTISTLIPAGLLNVKVSGSEVVVTNQGSNDLISVSKPVTTGNWRLKYDKKYLYEQ